MNSQIDQFGLAVSRQDVQELRNAFLAGLGVAHDIEPAVCQYQLLRHATVSQGPPIRSPDFNLASVLAESGVRPTASQMFYWHAWSAMRRVQDEQLFLHARNIWLGEEPDDVVIFDETLVWYVLFDHAGCAWWGFLPGTGE